MVSVKLLKQNGLSFYAKIKFLDGKVIIRQSSSKKKIFNFLRQDYEQIKWIYIRVIYKKGIYNDGKYLFKDINEMWKALYAFTEESFIKEVINEY